MPIMSSSEVSPSTAASLPLFVPTAKPWIKTETMMLVLPRAGSSCWTLGTHGSLGLDSLTLRYEEVLCGHTEKWHLLRSMCRALFGGWSTVQENVSAS